MSVPIDAGNGKITVPDILSRKTDVSAANYRRKIVCLTAYDFPSARLVDDAGVDVILVGDSLAMVVLGHENTLIRDGRRNAASHPRGAPRCSARIARGRHALRQLSRGCGRHRCGMLCASSRKREPLR